MAGNDPNGRIKTADRLARIEVRLDTIIEELKCVKDQERRLAAAESDVKVLRERWGWLAGGITLLNALGAIFLNKILVKP